MIRLTRTGLPAICLLFTLASISLQSCAIPANLRHEQATGSSRDRALGHEQAQVLFAKVDQAESAYQQSQWQDAAALYQAVLKQLPDDPYLWFRLGNALTQQGQYDQAIEAFETSIRQDARQAKPWFNLSTAHLLGAQLASLKAWQAMDPGDPGRQAAQQRLDGVTRLLQ